MTSKAPRLEPDPLPLQALRLRADPAPFRRQPREARRRGRRRAGRPEPPPGRRRALRVSIAALEGCAPRRRGRPRQDDRSRAGPLAAVGRATAAHPRHRPGEPAQAVASGAGGEVLPSLPDPRSRSRTTPTSAKARLRPFEAGAAQSSSARTSSPQAKAADVASTPWDLVVIDEAHRLRNVYKPTNIIASTLKQALRRRTQAAADGDAAPELAARAVRPRQHHRRARLRRPRELPRAVSVPRAAGAGLRRPARAAAPDLPPDPAPAGARPTCRTRAGIRSSRSSRRRRARTGSTTSCRSTCGATTSRRCRPASAA